MIGIKLNIANKILTAFLLVSLFPVIFVGYTFYKTTESRLRDEVFNNLSSIADSRTRMFENYIGEKGKGAGAFAVNPTVVKAMEHYNKVFHEIVILQVRHTRKYSTDQQKYPPYIHYSPSLFCSGYSNLCPTHWYRWPVTFAIVR